MKQAIETRELFILDGDGSIVPGTYHKTDDDHAGIHSGATGRQRIGVVFLNSLSPTRAAHGDGAVYWADLFARRGYPSFRLDLPGFGDSEQDPPKDWFAFVNRGGYAAVASAKITELVARFNLSGVILYGHCSGAVSAIYTAAVNRECRGLILMAPYFHTPVSRPEIREHLSAWASRSRSGRFFSSIYSCMKEARLALGGQATPENANLPLLGRWKEAASTGMPILVLAAPGPKSSRTRPKLGEFDYIQYILQSAGRKSRVVAKSAEGSNHSFSNPVGRAAAQTHTGRWLDAYFPRTKPGDSDESAARSEPDKKNTIVEIATLA